MKSPAVRLKALLELRDREVETAERALAGAVRHLEDALARLAAAKARFDDAMERAASEVGTAWDLGYSRTHLETLRGGLDRLAAEISEARVAEAHARGVMVEAKREKKKLELWCDARTREIDAEEARVERRATDEIALRGARRHD